MILSYADGVGNAASCRPNTEISGEPPSWPWLVRCISLFDGLHASAGQPAQPAA